MGKSDHCAAVGCRSRRSKTLGVKFHFLPADFTKRRIWLQRINRQDLVPTKNTCLCSKHFYENRKTAEQPLPVNFEHRVYPLCRKAPRKRKKNSEAKGKKVKSKANPAGEIVAVLVDHEDEEAEEVDVAEEEDQTEIAVATDEAVPSLEEQVASLQQQLAGYQATTQRNSELEEAVAGAKAACGMHRIKDDEELKYYTGLSSIEVFRTILEYVESVLKKKKRLRGRPSHLKLADEFLLVLMRLRLGLQVQDLRYRFNLRDKGRVSKLIRKWIKLLVVAFKPLLLWPSKRQVSRNMPEAFRCVSEYRNVRIILDCAEFEMESPSSLSVNSMTYSDYKGRNTVKVLFGVTPDGYISFVSRAYPGSISDNAITVKSGVLDKLSPGDHIMADKGFTLSKSELTPRGLTLVVPPFRCGGAQFTAEEVDTTKKIANLRIVVENCIMRTRYCRFLRHRIPVSSVTVASDVVVISSVLANFRPSIR